MATKNKYLSAPIDRELERYTYAPRYSVNSGDLNGLNLQRELDLSLRQREKIGTRKYKNDIPG